uniref:Uncharacterized protein n=1 Tax=Kalanchoe fedtschenkoi TaxID=63787 RepID=A0A7N0V689_KALFE
MASGALNVDKSRGERKLVKRNRVKQVSVPQSCSQAVRSSEEDDFSHLFRANEEWYDASGGNRRQDDDNLVDGDEEIETNGLDSVFTGSHSYLVINVSALKTRKEIRKWKRRLTDELEQVRDMARQLEDQYSNMGGLEQMMADEVASRIENTTQDCSEVAPVHQQDDLFVSLSCRGGHKSAKKLKKAPKTNMEIDVLVSKKGVPASMNAGKPATGISQSDKGNYVVQAFKSCKSLLRQLMKHKFAWVFSVPVDAERFHLYDYHAIIKHPMDLGTVKDRLTTNWYESPMEFAEDVRLTFRNAMTYNPKSHDVHLMAERLLEIFEKKWLGIEDKYSCDMMASVGSDVDMVAPTSERIPHPSTSTPSMRISEAFESSYSETPASSAPPGQQVVPNLLEVQRTTPSLCTLDALESSPDKTPVNSSSPGQDVIPEMPEVLRTSPSTRTMNALESHSNEMPVNCPSLIQETVPEIPEIHKDMSFEEKLKLNACIQELPSIKLGGVVDIIKKRNAALFQNEDEVELDINCLDAETLWELETFVLECNGDLGTAKRKGENSYQTSTELDYVPIEEGASKVPRRFNEQFSAHMQRHTAIGIKSSNSGNYLYSSSRDVDHFRY